jgi:hypothetical protein
VITLSAVMYKFCPKENGLKMAMLPGGSNVVKVPSLALRSP